MADEPNLEDVIRENATGPKRAEGDSVVVEQHSLHRVLHVAQDVDATLEAAHFVAMGRVHEDR